MAGAVASLITEADWEADAMRQLDAAGWRTVPGTSIAPDGERASWDELIIPRLLRDAIARINPSLPMDVVDRAAAKILDPEPGDALAQNHEIHQFLTEGIRLTYTDASGAECSPTIQLIDARNTANNDFFAANQVRVVSGEHTRVFDIVLYLNGLPVAVFELKRPTSDGQALRYARNQLDTYLNELPRAFRCNAVCVVSDGLDARYGTAWTPYEHFAPWNVDDLGRPLEQVPIDSESLLSVRIINGLFSPVRFVDFLLGYVTFARSQGGPVKRIAKPHQYFAVTAAVRETLKAVREQGRAGVVWHTQGSGKSMEMELYAYHAMRQPELRNPTIIVCTDRTDLDDQLFGVFAASEQLRETPVRAESRDELRTALEIKRSGGIVFTTLQKFSKTLAERYSGADHPLLSDRRNIIMIVDEAHRSHYGILNGFARNLRDALPYAAMIAFTGTPIAEGDRFTTNVFGPVIDTYDLTRAVRDGATVRVFYESRVIELELPPDTDPDLIDERADEATAGMDDAERDRLHRTALAMDTLYGAEDRLRALASDITEHWAIRSRQMRKFIDGPGKGLIVCGSREICARLYEQFIELNPDWEGSDDHSGRIKVVISGSPFDPAHLQRHVRSAAALQALARRAKDPDDPLELIIVSSMWLTGFDSPPLHTLYVDKPMRGANLMQALARVNRKFRGKEDGLLVGYAPLTQNLVDAIAEYSETDRIAQPVGLDIDDAIGSVYDLLSVIGDEILSSCDWRGARARTTEFAHRDAVLKVVNFLRDPVSPGNSHLDDREPTLGERFRRQAAQLTRMYALCSSAGALADARGDIAFFEEVRVWMARYDAEERLVRGDSVPLDVEIYLRSLASGAVEASGVRDIYDAAGIGRPDLSHLDAAFIQRMREQRNPHLAIEALRRLVEQEMRRVTRHNVVRQESFTERLEELMRRYVNQQLTAAQIIAELVELAREVAADDQRGARFDRPLTADELAFYDAVARDPVALDVMGASKLADIARDLVRSLRRDVTTDWMTRDDVRARIRSTIKRLLAKHDYPPEGEETATELVLKQMETFADEWAPRARRATG